MKVEVGGMTLLIERSDVQAGGLVEATALEEVEKRLDQMLEVIKPFSQSIKKSVEALGADRPSSVSAEFGLGFSLEGNIFFVKASGEATIKVTLNWGKV